MKNLLLFALLLPYSLWSQNLVPNASFENNTGCPTQACQWNLATDWTNISGRIGCGTSNSGTPDYFNTCGTGNFSPPVTRYAQLSPRTGNAMMGLSTFRPFSPNFREYLSVQLDSVLQPGIPYEVSFAYANGLPGFGSVLGGIGTEFGLHFSNGPLTQAGRTPIILTPSYETNGTVYSTGWQVINFIYTPVAPVDYLTIGNFRDDANTTAVIYELPTFFSFSYYFFDDISVEKASILDASGTVIEQSENSDDQFYTYNQTLRIQLANSETQRVSLAIQNVQGKVIHHKMEEVTGNAQWSLPYLAPGLYIARMQTARGAKILRFQVP
jgi:OOP family OmpA-OmpF porin